MSTSYSYSFPVFIYWDSGTNPESNDIVARFNNEEELEKIFPLNFRDSFLDLFYQDNVQGYEEEEQGFMDYYNNNLAGLSGSDALNMIDNDPSFNEMCEEYFCEDSFYVFSGYQAFRMLTLASRRRLRVTDKFLEEM